MPVVLVVDDAPFMRLRMSRVLAEAGYAVIHAENGVAAVRQYVDRRPDAVLMDITMPEMDGFAALKQIRECDVNARVAMVSSLGQRETVLDAVKAGARDFLVKPCETERILLAVRRLCQSKA